MKRKELSATKCPTYFGEEGYCPLGDQCENRHDEDAVLVFSAADLEQWELEEERAKLCGKERRENHDTKFKVLEFRTVHPNYDAAQKRAPVRAENSSYPQRPPGPLAMNPKDRRPQKPPKRTMDDRTLQPEAVDQDGTAERQDHEKRPQEDPNLPSPSVAPEGPPVAKSAALSETVGMDVDKDGKSEAQVVEDSTSQKRTADSTELDDRDAQALAKKPRISTDEEDQDHSKAVEQDIKTDIQSDNPVADDKHETPTGDQQGVPSVASNPPSAEVFPNARQDKLHEPVENRGDPEAKPDSPQQQSDNPQQAQVDIELVHVTEEATPKNTSTEGSTTVADSQTRTSSVSPNPESAETSGQIAGVRKSDEGKIVPIVDLRQNSPVPWKRRQAIAERFAEFLTEGGMDRVQACLKAVAVELELVESCSSPLDYQSCAAARFRQMKSQKSL
ncbi:hypothetical protein NDN08_000913 [Rhodosorus marinus]|uniref:C3H1-type domain-containing protein n=1 Tax=Rhodosorus marinus TaxID=101924 RepID=A0AAV8UPK5_9RHOD|nr:hypothetical protein NDN08_000913 [Rhodosorus marinus]